MDQQNKKAVPTAEEIARLEAEAVRAMGRGAAQPDGEAAQKPARSDFVPYVDDAPEDNFVPYVDDAPKPAPQPAAAEAEEEDDDEPYIPGPWEKRIDALSPQQWKRWQIIGGAAVGLASVACLFVFGQELATYGLILAVCLAVLLPRYLERAWRHPLATARMAMIAALVAGLVVMGIITFARGGFTPRN